MNEITKDADLHGAKFINTNLGGAQFHDVNLASSQFTDVNLSGTHFDDINFSGAVIRNANCSHVSMEDACYEGMRIDGILVTELLAIYRKGLSKE
jgi:uncharacterized protein YjbI with pentapeptide repeats